MTSEAVSRLERYRLDAAASTFTVQAFAAGLFSAFGHDPVIGVRKFEGEVAFVPVTFDDVSVKLRIDASSLAVVNDLKEKDRREIEQTMREQVLEIRKYPEIVFQSSSISLARLGEGRYRARVIGALTLHGVTQNNIWISGEVTMRPDGLRAKGEFTVKQTDYSIRLVSVAGGTLKIRNEVKGRFDILARRDG